MSSSLIISWPHDLYEMLLLRFWEWLMRMGLLLDLQALGASVIQVFGLGICYHAHVHIPQPEACAGILILGTWALVTSVIWCPIFFIAMHHLRRFGLIHFNRWRLQAFGDVVEQSWWNVGFIYGALADPAKRPTLLKPSLWIFLKAFGRFWILYGLGIVSGIAISYVVLSLIPNLGRPVDHFRWMILVCALEKEGLLLTWHLTQDLLFWTIPGEGSVLQLVFGPELVLFVWVIPASLFFFGKSRERLDSIYVLFRVWINLSFAVARVRALVEPQRVRHCRKVATFGCLPSLLTLTFTTSRSLRPLLQCMGAAELGFCTLIVYAIRQNRYFRRASSLEFALAVQLTIEKNLHSTVVGIRCFQSLFTALSREPGNDISVGITYIDACLLVLFELSPVQCFFRSVVEFSDGV